MAASSRMVIWGTNDRTTKGCRRVSDASFRVTDGAVEQPAGQQDRELPCRRVHPEAQPDQSGRLADRVDGLSDRRAARATRQPGVVQRPRPRVGASGDLGCASLERAQPPADGAGRTVDARCWSCGARLRARSPAARRRSPRRCRAGVGRARPGAAHAWHRRRHSTRVVGAATVCRAGYGSAVRARVPTHAAARRSQDTTAGQRRDRPRFLRGWR